MTLKCLLKLFSRNHLKININLIQGTNMDNKTYPEPPSFHRRLNGYHWLQKVTHDNKPEEPELFIWDPSGQCWTQPSLNSDGYYTKVDLTNWVYIQSCQMPYNKQPKDFFERRGYCIKSDVFGGMKPVDTIVNVKFNNYVICFSTAGLSRGNPEIPVAVYNHDLTTLLKDGFVTVQDAIEWCINPDA